MLIKIISLLLLSWSVSAKPINYSVVDKFVDVAEGRRVFYRVDNAVGRRQGTLLLFNGLLYTDGPWAAYTEEMQKRGYRVVRFDYSTRPIETTGLDGKPYFLEKSSNMGWP